MLNWTDVYEGESGGGGTVTALGPTGPNQSVVTGAGQSLAPSGRGPAFSWLGLALALVLLRLLVYYGGRASA